MFLILENLENKTTHFFLDFPVFIEKITKTQCVVWIFVGFHRKIQKKTIVVFGFSMFLLLEILLEILESQKNHCVFWIFQ